jgi:hypothetical protein
MPQQKKVTLQSDDYLKNPDKQAKVKTNLLTGLTDAFLLILTPAREINFYGQAKKNKKHRRGISDRDTVVFGRLLQIDKLLFVYLH